MKSRPLLAVAAAVGLSSISFASQGVVERLHVRSDAPGTMGDGSSWSSAFRHLQDALEEAEARLAGGCGCTVEIWVKEGTYYPDRSRLAPGGTGDRSASFELLDEVAVYGGFEGTETTLAQRSHTIRSTLSGAIGDGPNTGSIHVVDASTGSSTTADRTRLDGFVITGGDCSDQASPENRGAGLHMSAANVTVVNCILTRNLAGEGGAASCDENGLALIVNTRFLDNDSLDDGGAYFQAQGRTLLVQCVFEGNACADHGGAITFESFGGSGSLAMTSTVFRENRAPNYADDLFVRGTTADVLSFNSVFWSEEPLRLQESGYADLRSPVIRGGLAGIDTTSTGTFDLTNLLMEGPRFGTALGSSHSHDSSLIDSGDPNGRSQDVADLDRDGNVAEPTPLDLNYHPRVVNGALDRGATEGLIGSTTACVPEANSTGSAGHLRMHGSPRVVDEFLEFTATGVPNQPGIFFYGTGMASSPVGDGRLCIGGVIQRLDVAFASGNRASLRLDWSDPYVGNLVAGTTRYIQFWFRDPQAAGAGFNFSDAAAMQLAP